MSHALPGLGLTGGYSPGDDGWSDAMNTNLLKLSVLAQGSVKSRVTALPGSPSNGDIYIVPSGGDANKIAVRDSGAWTYLVPTEGWRVWVQDEDTVYNFNGTAWVAGQPFDVATFVAGTPSASEVVMRYVFARAVSFPDDFAGSYALAGTAATASTTFTLKKNGSSIGTIVFAISGTTGTLTTTGGGTTFAAGDILSVEAPSSPDATLANVSMTFAGLR